MYGFGENDLLCQAQYPWLRKIQESFRSFSGIAPVMFYGRGIFQYSFGLMPFRVPVTLVGKSLSLSIIIKVYQDVLFYMPIKNVI